MEPEKRRTFPKPLKCSFKILPICTTYPLTEGSGLTETEKQTMAQKPVFAARCLLKETLGQEERNTIINKIITIHCSSAGINHCCVCDMPAIEKQTYMFHIVPCLKGFHILS